jgi:ubiquinone/menaquinone biosynthesis C-methylase UbiE
MAEREERPGLRRGQFTSIAHSRHVYCSPLSDDKVGDALSTMSFAAPPKMFDLGCGKGEMLIRALERFGGEGLGIDNNPVFLDAARTRAAHLPAGQLTLRETDADDLALPPRTYDLGICVGALEIWGTYEDGLRRMASAVREGGYVVAGTTYWKQEPDPAYLAYFGAGRDMCGDYAETLAIVKRVGLSSLYVSTSSEDDWDRYEWRYRASAEAWIESHPDAPERSAVRDRSEQVSDAYVRWGRRTLGFALIVARWLGDPAEEA